MTSIARKINMEYWLKQFTNFLVLDIVLLVLVAIGFFMWREGMVPEGAKVIDRELIRDSFGQLQYVIQTEKGESLIYAINDLKAIIKIPVRVILILQAIMLVGELFGASRVRHHMKPLYEMAVKMDEVARQPFSMEKMENIQQAISSVNTDMPDAKVTTGDEDLRSLELAINSLIERMRESHRQQERFVSDASHELRTPIAVIQGYVNMLDRWGKSDEQILNESIEALKNESEHMKNLVEQLLFLARGDSGRNTLEFVDFDLSEIVREVYDESVMIDEHHKYELHAEEPAIVHGDMAMLKQSMRIMIQNAAKYSHAGDTIALGAKSIEGRPAYFIQDEGIGMGESEVVHVFERFYRADGARSSQEGGTGLGLSIAKWIVDAHKGEIEILSRPEFGTRFTVKL